eukprot:SAG11_NODE_7522_length_1135_cov_1.086873_1_plen_23_part_10
MEALGDARNAVAAYEQAVVLAGG